MAWCFIILVLVTTGLCTVTTSHADYATFDLKHFFMSFYNPRLMDLPPLSRGGRELEAQSSCNLTNPSFEILENLRINAPRCVLQEFPYVNTIGECIGHCQQDQLCHSVQITEGVCTLYSISYDDRPELFEFSQVKGLHVVAQRRCSPAGCNALWQSELVPNYRLKENILESIVVRSRGECADRCLVEPRCKSANYDGTFCELNIHSRQSLATNQNFCPELGVSYIENNCIVEPSQVCTFERHENLIPYTFDAFFLSARNEDECKAQCTSDPQGCRSYTFGLFANIPMCFVTHQTNYELLGREDLFCTLANVTTNELKSCYNFQTECIADGLSIRFDSSRQFSGQVYPPQSPNCRVEVDGNNEFYFVIPYEDEYCNVTIGPTGFYETEIEVQHYRPYITSPDFIMNAVFECSPPEPTTTATTPTTDTPSTYPTTGTPPTYPPTTVTSPTETPPTTSPTETPPTLPPTTPTTARTPTSPTLPPTTKPATPPTYPPTTPSTYPPTPPPTRPTNPTSPPTYPPTPAPTQPTPPSQTQKPSETDEPLSQTTCPPPKPIYITQNATCPPKQCPACKPQGPPQLGITVLHRNGTMLTEDPKIGDPVALAFFVSDVDTPFVPRITDVAAVNVNDDSVFQMLDKRGCPVMPYIASKIYKFAQGLYFSDFDAFTFKQLDTLRYRAQVEWCWQKCAPPICDDNVQEQLANQNDVYIDSFQGNKL